VPRNNKNWTVGEKVLLELLARGVHRSKIAQALNRTKAAIEARASAIRNCKKLTSRTRKPQA
jgi:DNA-binding NarL/FixJ family response regulator